MEQTKYKLRYNFWYINSTVRIFKYFKIMIIFDSQHIKKIVKLNIEMDC